MKIYLCPALMDCLAFLILFAVMYGAGERLMTSAQCAWLGGLFPITYMVFSVLTGSILTRRNARVFLLAGTVLFVVAGTLCLALKLFMHLLLALALMGIALAIFFNAFQTFMRGEAQPGRLPRTVGLYTLAWSLGSALGVFSSGFFYRYGAPFLCGLNAAAGLTILGILSFHRAADVPRDADEAPLDHSASRPVNPNYVWVGWAIIFTAMFVQRPVHTFYPSLSAQAGIGSFESGIPLALHLALQGAAAMGLFPLKNLLYRKTALLLFQGAAAAVLFLTWLRPGGAAAMIGIALLGIYTGFAYYAAVFYASNSRRSSFNIGVNEFLVGLGSFAGLFAVEGWMSRSGDRGAMYLVGALALLLSTGVQLVLAGRRRAAN